MWGWVGMLAATTGLKGLQWLMEGDPLNPKRHVFYRDVELELPRTESGAPLPLYFGTVRVKSPVLAAAFGYGSDPVTYNGVTVDRWKGNFLYVLGVPCPSGAVTLREIRIDDKLVHYTSGGPSITNSGTAAVEDNTFMGGPLQGGGIRGTVEFRGGNSPTQTLVGSSFETQWKLLSTDPVDPTGALLPGHRGQTIVALTGRWRWGENPRMVSYQFRVTADCSHASIGNYAMVNGVDANPIAVLRALISDKWFGLGFDAALIDDATFDAAAITLAAENHGVSGIVYTREQGIRLISMLLDQIEGALYRDKTDGLFKIKLVRNDYDPDLIPVLNASSIESFDGLEMTAQQNAPNEVVVNFTDWTSLTAKTSSMPAQNTANVALNGGRVQSVPRDYPFVSNERLASQLASRDLATLSLPMFTAKVVSDQSVYDLHPGDAVKVVYDEFGWDDGVVVRVVDVDQGTLDEEKLILTVVQDRFGVDYGIFDNPPSAEDPPAVPFHPKPIVEYDVHEAPRILMTHALWNTWAIDDQQQRLNYLAVPLSADTYRGDFFVDPLWPTDLLDRTFCGIATVETAYSYLSDPYDTSVGLRIQDVSPAAGNPGTPPLISASSTDIANGGVNLIYVNGEYLAFESVTTIGGGVFRLNNVWRALMDTKPRSHPVGSRVYFLNTLDSPMDLGRHVGARVWSGDIGDQPTLRLVPSGGGLTMDPNRAHAFVDAAIRNRWHLPLRGANVLANSGKAISSLREDGLTMAWKRRAAGTTIVRGDAASETVGASTEYWPIGKKSGYTDVELTASGAPYNVESLADVATGKIGHGSIEVAMQTRAQVEEGGGTLVNYTSWDDPGVLIVAERWRNLLLNPRFADGMTNWTTVSGTPSVGSASPHGGSGFYVRTTVNGGYAISQTRDVHGYDVNGALTSLSAIVGWYAIGDGTDTLQVKIELLDDALSVLATGTFAAAAPGTTWGYNEQSVAYVAGVKKVKVTFTTTAGELAPSTIFITDTETRVGQVTSQLLANGSFEPAVGSWTTVTGSWVTGLTTVLYEAAKYIRGGGNATNELAQSVSVPTGFEADAVAVLHIATMRDGSDTDDTGEVILEAYDGTPTLLDSATSGVYTPATDSVWERKTVALDLPAGTVSVKVRLRALRVGDAGDANICFDHARLKIHKTLDYSTQDHVFSSPPVQPIPGTYEELVYAWPDIGWQTLTGIWDGASSVGARGGEPTMLDSGIAYDAAVVVPWDGETIRHPAYRFTGGTGGPDLSASGSTFGNFSGSGSFWALAWIRVDDRAFSGTRREVFGRYNGVNGWEVTIGTDGKVTAKIYGTAASVSATSAGSIVDGRWHLVGIRYKPALVAVIVDGVVVETSASGYGSISTPASSTAWFRIGRSKTGGNSCPMQMAALWFGGSSLNAPPTDAQIATLFRLSDTPTGASATVGSVEGGVVLLDEDGKIGFVRCPAASWKIAPDPVTGAWCFPLSPQCVNLVSSQDFGDAGEFAPNGSPTITTGQLDVEGRYQAVKIVGTNTQYVETLVAVANVPVLDLVLFAKQDGSSLAPGCHISVCDVGLSEIDAFDLDLDADWHRFDMHVAWSAGTVAVIRIYPSSTSNSFPLVVSPPWVVHQDGKEPIVLPYEGQDTSGGATITASSAMPGDFNYGGEIVAFGRAVSESVTGTLVTVGNGTNDDNKRMLLLGSGPEIRATNYNATGTGTTSEVASTISDAEWVARARWSRAGIIDSPTNFAGVMKNATADYDVVAAFTATNAAPVAAVIGVSGTANPAVYLRRVLLTHREIWRTYSQL